MMICMRCVALQSEFSSIKMAQFESITLCNSTIATPSDSNGNENVVATTQHKSNFCSQASVETALHFLSSLTKLSRLDFSLFATLFETFLVIIIVITPVVSIITGFQVKDTPMKTTSIDEETTPTTLTTVATTSTTTTTSSTKTLPVSTSEALKGPVPFITQSGYKSVTRIELLCAKGESLVEDCAEDLRKELAGKLRAINEIEIEKRRRGEEETGNREEYVLLRMNIPVSLSVYPFDAQDIPAICKFLRPGELIRCQNRKLVPKVEDKSSVSREVGPKVTSYFQLQSSSSYVSSLKEDIKYKESGSDHFQTLLDIIVSTFKVSRCCINEFRILLPIQGNKQKKNRNISSKIINRLRRREKEEEEKEVKVEDRLEKCIEIELQNQQRQLQRQPLEKENSIEAVKIRSSYKFKHLLEAHSYLGNQESIQQQKRKLFILKRNKIIRTKLEKQKKVAKVRIKRFTKLINQVVFPVTNEETKRLTSNSNQLETSTTNNSKIIINPYDQTIDHERMNEDLVELLAQFYAHTQEIKDKLEHYLYLSKIQNKNNKTLNDKGEFNELVEKVNSSSRRNNNNSLEFNHLKKGEIIKKGKLNESESESSGKNIRINGIKKEEEERLIKEIKMKLGADEENLLKWLRQKQEKFSSLKNATFELLNEPPNRTINVCQDGPKILVLPNVSDIFYCYSSEQWVDKLWSDLHLSAFHYPIIMLNILIFLFGTTGNIFVCLSVYRNHQLRNVTNYFIVNLAFADFLVILICLPATVIWDLSLTWFFGTIPCKLIMFLQDVSISVSVLTLTAISIDRYYAVCYPLKFKSSLNQAKRIIVLIWIVSLILMAPDLIYLSAKYSQELSEAGLDTVLYSDCNYDWSEQSSRIFQFVKTILLYLLPFILMLCAHYKIMLTLRAASQSVHDDKLEVNQAGVELQELEPVNEGKNPSSNIQEEEEEKEKETNRETDKEEENLYRRGGQKVNKPSTFRGTNRHFPSISMSPPSPLLQQIRFYQNSSSRGDMLAMERPTTSSSISRPVNVKVETDPEDNYRSIFREFFTRFSRKNSSRPVTVTAGQSSLAEYLNRTRGSITSYQMSTDDIFPTNSTTAAKALMSTLENRNRQLSTKNQSNNQLSATMHNKSKLDSRRAAAKMLMTIVVLFGICYLPVHLINFLRQFLDNIPQTDITSTISMLSHCACYLNSAINPIIYNHMNSIFRAEFKKFLSCLFCWKKRPERNTEPGSSSRVLINSETSVKAKRPNVAGGQRKTIGLVHQKAINDNDNVQNLNEPGSSNQADKGESTKLTDLS